MRCKWKAPNTGHKEASSKTWKCRHLIYLTSTLAPYMRGPKSSDILNFCKKHRFKLCYINIITVFTFIERVFQITASKTTMWMRHIPPWEWEVTCSAVKSGSSLMQETMIECMSICSLSSSSSDRSRDWLSNFCPGGEAFQRERKKEKQRETTWMRKQTGG